MTRAVSRTLAQDLERGFPSPGRLWHPHSKPFRGRLVAEVRSTPSHPPAPITVRRPGRRDRPDDESLVVFDWTSDVAPKEDDRAAYRQQLAQYLHATGAQRCAVVYLTSGRVDWVVRSKS